MKLIDIKPQYGFWVWDNLNRVEWAVTDAYDAWRDAVYEVDGVIEDIDIFYEQYEHSFTDFFDSEYLDKLSDDYAQDYYIPYRIHSFLVYCGWWLREAIRTRSLFSKPPF